MTIENTYTIEGMTCEGCVSTVQSAIAEIDGVQEVLVSLNPPQATIKTNKPITTSVFQNAIGHYVIKDKALEKQTLQPVAEEAIAEKSITTYKPLFIIVGYIFLVSLLAQYPFNDFSSMTWMRYFMAGFFLVFSFFKLLNLQGFASTYSMYDIVADKWFSWGYIYPFVELGLGILYLTNIAPFETNMATAVILGVSSIGVIKSVLSKKTIKCACLGDVFNLPMSTVTIVEDVLMVIMALVMLSI